MVLVTNVGPQKKAASYIWSCWFCRWRNFHKKAANVNISLVFATKTFPPKKLSSHIFSLILSMKVWVFLLGTKPQWCYMLKNKYTTHLHRFQTHCPLHRFTQPTWNEKKHDILLLFSSSTYLYTSHVCLLLLSPSSSFHINHITNSQWVPPSSLKGPAADAEALKFAPSPTRRRNAGVMVVVVVA